MASFSTLHPFLRQPRFITSLFFLISGFIAATWSSRIPAVQRSMGLDDAQWGGILFWQPAGLVAALFIAGYLIEKAGTKRIIVSGSLCYCLSLILIAVASAPWHLILALFLFGFTRNIFNLSINTHAVKVQQFYPRPVISSFHAVWSISCIAAAGIASLIIGAGIITLYHFIIIALVCIAVTAVYLNMGGKTLKQKPAVKSFIIRPDKKLIQLGIICLCVMICEGAVFDWSVNYFQQVVKTPRSYSNLGYTCFIVTMALGRLMGDKFTARFGEIKMLFFNGFMMSAGFIITGAFPFLIPASFGLLLAGLGDAINIPLIYSLSAKMNAKVNPSHTIAMVSFVGYIGLLAGPILLGYVSKMFGMQWSFILLAIISLTIPVLTLSFKKHMYP